MNKEDLDEFIALIESKGYPLDEGLKEILKSIFVMIYNSGYDDGWNDKSEDTRDRDF